MAHFAEIGLNNTVLRVIVVNNAELLVVKPAMVYSGLTVIIMQPVVMGLVVSLQEVMAESVVDGAVGQMVPQVLQYCNY
jgi:hypothetical protein